MKRLFIILLLLVPAVTISQFISIKSLPVSTGDQFVLFPSKNLSMGGVNIGLCDPWAEPIKNPANGSGVKNLNLFAAPTFYNVSDNLGGAWSVPVTIFAEHKNWFGVTSFTYQQLKEAGLNNGAFIHPGSLTATQERTHNNKYVFISLGRKLLSGEWSVGGSFFWSNINAMGGVDLLYNNSAGIEQDGNIYELRGGLMYENEFSTFEAVLLFNKIKIRHDVKYNNWIFSDASITWDQNFRTETNLDQTNTWGIHLKYKEKMTDEGLYLGALTTVNLKTHPKIPNYEIMNIPRDPGDSWAFNFGIGLGIINKENTRFGIDLIYEPIRSNTWAEAAEDIILWEGKKILAGEKTVENNFVFNNIIGRIGINVDFKIIDLSAGVEFYGRQYSLDQTDFVNESRRSQEEDWTETTWTWGLGMHFKYFEIKYTGHAVTGAGIPGTSPVVWWGINNRLEDAAFDIIAAPSGSLNLDEKTTTMHQFIISVPLIAGW